MLPADRPEFVRILNGLAALKPGKPFTSEGLDLFWAAMGDWSIEDFRSAAAQLARAAEFMPNPYHFEKLRKAAQLTAGEAWARALRHAASSAYRQGLLGNDAIDAAVAALGGYVAIAMCDEEKTPFLERRFAEHYEAISDAAGTREALPQLGGTRINGRIADLSNRLRIAK